MNGSRAIVRGTVLSAVGRGGRPWFGVYCGLVGLGDS